MKRSDSTNTLEETLDISSDNKDKKQEKTQLERLSDIQYQTNPLKKSFSEDTVTSLIEQEIPLTPPAKIKSRSRLSSAFRSLRVTKSSRKKPVPESTTATGPITTPSSIDPTEGGLITSGEEIEIEQKSEDKEKIKKKTKLSKKFTLNIRKYRTTSKKSSNSSSEQHNQELSGATSKPTTTLQYHPLSELGSISSKTNRNKDNNNKLNVSQVSLVDLPSDNETEYDDNNINDDNNNNNNNNENRKEIFKQKESKNSQHKQNIINRDGVNFIITSDSDKYNKENSKLKQQKQKQQKQEIFNEPDSPLKFEKVRKIQITIKGKKIEHINRDKLPTTTTSISGEDDYLTATEVDQTTKRTTSVSPSISNSRKLIQSEQEASQAAASNKRQSRKKTKSNTKSSSTKENQQFSPDQSPEKSEKLVITQSSRDTPPSERAPPKPTLSSSQNNSPDLNKGAIRKTSALQQQQQHKSKKIASLENPSSGGDLLMRERSKSPLLERGRRYPRGPRPLDEELSAAEKLNLQNPKTGNNLQNPNLSGSIGVIEAKEIQFDFKSYPPLPPTPPTPTETISSNSTVNNSDNNKTFEFSVGKFVRSQPVSQLNIADSQQPDSILLPSGNPSPNKNQTIDRDRSVKKYQERDIEYYTDEEERELIDGINRDSYLSGISEYSLDSELIAIQQQQQKHKEQYQQQKQKELRQQEQEKLVVMPAFGDLTMDNEVAPIMTTSGDKREHLYKILIIGELGTGKTSFIKRYVHKFFSQNYRATIGVDFALKVLHWDQNTIIRLQLWDIAGQERFGNMTRVYYKDAVGAFIVFDVTRSGTFECVSKWKEDLDSKVQLPDGSPIPCILLANKCDQEKQGVVTNPDKMDEYVKENGFAGWFETSAKENVNIDESARALVNKILLNDKLISAGDLDADKIDLGGSSGYGGSGGKKRECAC